MGSSFIKSALNLNRKCYRKLLQIIMKFSSLLLLFAFCFPLCIYFIQFHNGFSDDYQVWSAFGDYISGVYSVVLTILMFYLANKIDKINEKKNDRKNAIKELYHYVIELSSRGISIDKANEFQLCVNKNQLFLLQADYEELMKFYDYCLEVIQNDLNKDISKEMKMKDLLIKLYNNV